MIPFVAWFVWSAAALSAAVWAWLNIPRYAKLLRHTLAQPGEGFADGPEEAGDGGPRAGGGAGRGGWPGVAILTPGRDEAEHLPTVLPELCEQDYPRHRVVFIDDASGDATPRITQAMAQRYDNLTVVRNEQPPPPGWMGKCWAIQQGYEALVKLEAESAGCELEGKRISKTSSEDSPDLSAGLEDRASAFDWLCFTDADIHWHPLLLRRAMAYCAEHDAELLGVAPTLRFGSAAEAIVQLQLILALGLMLPYDAVVNPDSPRTLTGGAFILVKRRYYDQIGGHTAVKGEMVEDLKLGMALKAAGARHRVALAGDLQWCRMYDGPADLWEGLTKNAYAGLMHRWWLALPACGILLITNVLPPVYFITALVWLILAPGGWMPATALLFSVVALLAQARALNAVRKLMDLPARYAWTTPLGSAAYLLIILASMMQYHTRGNTWKGRRYHAES